MISNALRHMVAENLRILNVKKSDPFDLICPDEVESVLGLDSDYNFWFTADSVYRLADLIDPYSGRRAKPTGKRKVKLYLVNDCGGEWERSRRMGHPAERNARARSLWWLLSVRA